MAEASIVAFGLTVGVLIGLGFVCFALRRIEYVKKTYNHDYDKVTIDYLHVHNDIK